jgi:hypothetical protein
MMEIVEAKAKAFKVKIVKHAETLLHEMNISSHSCAATFARNGHSSSFWTVHGRVYLKGICEKKLHLSESKVGRSIYALWHWGSRHCSFADVRTTINGLGRSEKEEVSLAASLMPAWLNKLCSLNNSRSRTRVAALAA